MPKSNLGLLPLKILNRTLIGSMVFLKGDTGPEVYTGAGDIPSRENFEKWVRGALYDPAMPDPEKEPERALRWLLDKSNRVGLGKMTVQEQALLKSLKEKLESLSGIEGLAKWAAKVWDNPKIENQKTRVWISWVFNEDGNSMGQYEFSNGKVPYFKNLPYLVNDKADKDHSGTHAEENFIKEFQGLKQDYIKYKKKQTGKNVKIKKVQILVKRSPCHNIDKRAKQGHSTCTKQLIDLVKKYTDIQFEIYYVDLYYGHNDTEINFSIDGIKELNSNGVSSNYFIKKITPTQKYYNSLLKYLEKIQREK